MMATTVADLTDLLKGIPAGAWVAISEREHRVISFGADAQAVLRESESKGEEHPLIIRVPDQNAALFL